MATPPIPSRNRPWQDEHVPYDRLTSAQRRMIKCYVVGHEPCTRGLARSCFASEDFLAVRLLVIDTGVGAGMLPSPALRTLAASVANLHWTKLQSALSFTSSEWHVFKEDVEEIQPQVQLEMSRAPAGGEESSSSSTRSKTASARSSSGTTCSRR